MTVRQLLNSLDSVELAEWYVMEDFDAWRQKVEEHDAKAPTADFVRSALFGKQIQRGEVQWQRQPLKQST